MKRLAGGVAGGVVEGDPRRFLPPRPGTSVDEEFEVGSTVGEGGGVGDMSARFDRATRAFHRTEIRRFARAGWATLEVVYLDNARA